ncbi:flagellar hook-basal body complex protein FliE [Kineosporia mesophila]|nr:flagellar hook-basal body complex protein FliE [Kineosporia mesophila]MCD5350673.1 flagellar hook-basal body complex protein FliE [Kineosporia mesophila]
MSVMPVAAVGVTDPSALISGADLYSQMAAGLGTADVGSIENISVPGAGTSAITEAASARSDSFGNALGKGLQSVENLDITAQNKAIGAATGDLNDVHDYVIAAVEAQTAVELTTTLRNKALESFQQIMGMQL